MKNNFRISFFIILIFGSVFFNACTNTFDVNKDPSTFNIDEAPVEQLITSGILTTAINLGANSNQICNMWAKYWTSGPGISVSPTDYYNVLGSTASVARFWSQSYARSMYDLYTVTKKSTSKHQIGICQVMLAYNYQLMADCFGDVPFTEALKGLPSDGGIVSPKYDADADVYSGIENLINDALSNIDNADDITDLSNVDPLYRGDLDLWKKFANTLKLKLYVRQFEVNPASITKASNLLTSGASFITTSTDAARIQFTPGSGSKQNLSPLYANLESRESVGNFYVLSNVTLNALSSKSDSRLDALYNLPVAGGSHAGLDHATGSGAADNLSKPSSKVYSPTVPIYFISEWESLFLQAETVARSGNVAGSQSLFEDAVYSSFNYLGASDASLYLSSNPYNTTDVESAVKSIAYEKWVSMNAIQPTESWIEIRRYDTPTRHIFNGTSGFFPEPAGNVLSLGDKYPVIFPYSEAEISSNKNAPLQRIDLSNPTYKAFWDN